MVWVYVCGSDIYSVAVAEVVDLVVHHRLLQSVCLSILGQYTKPTLLSIGSTQSEC